MGAPSCTGPEVSDVPRQFFTTLELLDTGALSKSETLEFGLERKAVPGRTGSRTLELLFLLVGPGPSPAAPLHRPPQRPQDPQTDCPLWTREGAASTFTLPVPLLAVLFNFHRIQVWMDKLKNPTKDAAEAVPRPNHAWGHLPSTHGRKITVSHLH